MPAVFDQLKRAEFDGLEFPVKRVTVKGQYRHHTHEYLKTPGGLNEKMARGLYTIEMVAAFDVNISGFNGSQSPLWPTVLDAMRKKYEQGITSDLVIPTIGTIRAFQTTWDQEMDVKVRSGEGVTLTFLEDQSEELLTEALADVDVASVGSSASKLEGLTKPMKPRPNLFDSIQDAANALFALKDQADMYGARVEAQIGALTGLIREADNDLAELQDPSNYKIVDALHELADAAIALGRRATGSRTEPRVYVVPKQMTVSQISTAVFGDATHAIELMQTNVFDDPFSVPAGYQVLYFVQLGIAA